MEKHGLVGARKEAWRQLSPNVQENILDNLGFHAEVARTIRRIEAEERYEEDGEAEIVPDVSIWNCDGCDLECSKNVRQLSFVGVSNVKMLRWLLSHKLMRPICQMSGCGGSSCFPVSLGAKSCGLKCPDCGRISVGGKRGIFPKSKLSYVKLMLLVFCISTGQSFAYLIKNFGVEYNKNTWTSYVKKIGLIAGEFLECNRRCSDFKWQVGQWDETAFGRR